MSIQRQATIVSSLTACILISVKFIIGILSGSVAILASAIDSLLDLSASLFNLYALTKAEKPANFEFNYGMGKIESLAAVIEGSVILVSGIFILYQSFKKLFFGGELVYLDYSLYVMLFSLILTTMLVLYLNYIAKKSNNLVIKADALHYKTDILSNGAVLVALVLVHWTHLHIIDAIFGIGIGIYVAYSAFGILKEGVLILLDKALEKQKVESVKQIIASAPQVQSYHDLKTRQSGETNLVEVHLVFDPNISLLDAHRVADSIECAIQNLEGKWEIITHLDPYDDEGAVCNIY
ncbi:MAG: cation diffusion facilitator family transporter [Helicobacter sp.]|uniref:cation diffusion facilitator family transporter n=1 Tax=Helicobacter sp. TaxID=218 RepID=UPI0023C9FD13|nr:cation diffusion facilitator family transporter [Helicobacter sp.]MDE5926130.1 cation diffusion facilitator family transporter [Helicobacter sp.]MDE7175128.1 cation diffusion facilitator family transporter [Helicobacter sp.]